MKDKLTHTLPQIKCSEKTRKTFDEMSEKTKRSISNIMQIYTEEICNQYEKTGNIFTIEIKLPEISA